MRPTRRLGLLGGTFDPVHFGHLDAAEAARDALALDRVLLIPSHDPPHRPLDPRASAFHRFALVALAISDRRGLAASDIELTRAGPSYTARTLRAFHAAGWAPSQLFFILGTDAFAEIATWYEYPSVLDGATFVIVTRPGTSVADALARTPELRARVGSSVLLVEARTRDVSSTIVRARLAARQPIEDLVPAAVARHIFTHGLYGAVDDLHDQEQRIPEGQHPARARGGQDHAPGDDEGRQAAGGSRQRREGGPGEEG